MEDAFDELDVSSVLTGHIGSHWQHLLTSLRDGHDVLKRLEDLVRECNKDVAFLDQARRTVRLKSAAENIAEFRQQVQSYKDTLQLSLQTVVL